MRCVVASYVRGNGDHFSRVELLPHSTGMCRKCGNVCFLRSTTAFSGYPCVYKNDIPSIPSIIALYEYRMQMMTVRNDLKNAQKTPTS